MGNKMKNFISNLDSASATTETPEAPVKIDEGSIDEDIGQTIDQMANNEDNELEALGDSPDVGDWHAPQMDSEADDYYSYGEDNTNYQQPKLGDSPDTGNWNAPDRNSED